MTAYSFLEFYVYYAMDKLALELTRQEADFLIQILMHFALPDPSQDEEEYREITTEEAVCGILFEKIKENLFFIPVGEQAKIRIDLAQACAMQQMIVSSEISEEGNAIALRLLHQVNNFVVNTRLPRYRPPEMGVRYLK